MANERTTVLNDPGGISAMGIGMDNARGKFVYFSNIAPTLADRFAKNSQIIRIAKTLEGVTDAYAFSGETELRISVNNHTPGVQAVARDLLIQMAEKGVIQQTTAEKAFKDLSLPPKAMPADVGGGFRERS